MLYGDFLNPNTDVKLYEEIVDHAKMTRIVEEFLEDYNQVGCCPSTLSTLQVGMVKNMAALLQYIQYACTYACV